MCSGIRSSNVAITWIVPPIADTRYVNYFTQEIGVLPDECYDGPVSPTYATPSLGIATLTVGISPLIVTTLKLRLLLPSYWGR